MLRSTGPALAALAALLLLAVPASGRDWRDSRRLWATINVCDTARHPGTVGIRASMPGLRGRRRARHVRMYMRFQVQYFARADRKWHNIASGADSGFIRVGSARRRVRRSGYDFRFAAPPEDLYSYVLRGAVTFQWRHGRHVVRHVRERTQGRHPTRAGSDPRGYSAPICEIRQTETPTPTP